MACYDFSDVLNRSNASMSSTRPTADLPHSSNVTPLHCDMSPNPYQSPQSPTTPSADEPRADSCPNCRTRIPRRSYMSFRALWGSSWICPSCRSHLELRSGLRHAVLLLIGDTLLLSWAFCHLYLAHPEPSWGYLELALGAAIIYSVRSIPLVLQNAITRGQRIQSMR
jgi:hypothetical protein